MPGEVYRNKILYKNLNFFDKIFVRKSCRRRFRNGLYGGKILLMGKCFVWGFDKLAYALLCGGDTKFKVPKAGNGNNVFFPNKRVRFARADNSCSSTVPTTSEAQTPTYVQFLPWESLSVNEHKQRSPARMRYSNHFCTLRTELQADAAPMLWFTDSKIPRLLNSLHRGREVHLD